MSIGRPYWGLQPKLVVGIDVGTTFSGVSYSILNPGAVPVIDGVNRFPAHENSGRDAKVPSVIYYDTEGSVRAVGAEALLESNVELALDEKWVKVEWFKLHLRPRHMALSENEKIPPLPPNKSIVEVFGDFLRYLYQCTQTYIRETHSGGPELWESLQSCAQFVLSHPNGWEGRQQLQMRQAAVHGGLIPDTSEGHSRLQFVTEGEASLHYCIRNNHGSDAVKSGKGVIIVDAGGGTIDLSAYYLKLSTNEFEEIAPATCHFQGSSYVSRRARRFLEDKLSNSRYGSADEITHITDCFDKSTKLAFSDPTKPAFIKFGTTRDTDPSADIKYGQLKLPGSDVATLFEPCITTIRRAIQEQKANASVSVASVLLVGGFAANNWLFSNLQTYLEEQELRLTRPSGFFGKAVADGAVSFFMDHFVSVRVARTTFGCRGHIRFQKRNPEHQLRADQVFIDVDGRKHLHNAFHVILAKGTRVTETTVFRQRFCVYFEKSKIPAVVRSEINAYRGTNPEPRWVDVDPDLYTVVCRVKADVTSAVRSLPLLLNGSRQYTQFHCHLELHFGLTEHKAQICWIENGEEKRSPATMVYDFGIGNN